MYKQHPYNESHVIKSISSLTKAFLMENILESWKHDELLINIEG